MLLNLKRLQLQRQRLRFEVSTREAALELLKENRKEVFEYVFPLVFDPKNEDDYRTL